MIYKFKSKATGDTLMLGPNGDAMLRLLGREPAPKGIIEPAAMPVAIQTLLRAAEEDAAQREAQPEPEVQGARRDPVSLRQRLWPMVEMLRQAHAAREPIVWGV
jgi:hypothetical protein